mgnify:CR=1 FL=1
MALEALTPMPMQTTPLPELKRRLALFERALEAPSVLRRSPVDVEWLESKLAAIRRELKRREPLKGTK